MVSCSACRRDRTGRLVRRSVADTRNDRLCGRVRRIGSRASKRLPLLAAWIPTQGPAPTGNPLLVTVVVMSVPHIRVFRRRGRTVPPPRWSPYRPVTRPRRERGVSAKQLARIGQCIERTSQPAPGVLLVPLTGPSEVQNSLCEKWRLEERDGGHQDSSDLATTVFAGGYGDPPLRVNKVFRAGAGRCGAPVRTPNRISLAHPRFKILEKWRLEERDGGHQDSSSGRRACGPLLP